MSWRSYAGSRRRIDRADVRRARAAVVVAHDEDRVGAARSGRGLDRVVADEAGRVERQLVAGRLLVELRSERPDERGVLVVEAGRDRLEVEVDAVCAAGPDGRGGLLGQIEPGGGVAEQRALELGLAGRPRHHADRQHDARALGVGGVDDRGHLRAGPAAPAGRRRAVGVELQQVAVLVGADAEVGDRREQVVVEDGVVDLPVGQEAHDLAAEVRGVEGGVAGRGREAGRGVVGERAAARCHWTGRRPVRPMAPGPPRRVRAAVSRRRLRSRGSGPGPWPCRRAAPAAPVRPPTRCRRRAAGTGR